MSIAGTNPISPFGRIVEDFEVGDMVPWQLAARSALRTLPWKELVQELAGDDAAQQSLHDRLEHILDNDAPHARPAIALGTFVGLTKMQSSRPTDIMPPFDGTTLLGFLRKRLQAQPDGAQAKIAVCGHSLGGTLTPVVALWIQEHLELMDMSDKAVVWAWSYAGAMPGNKAFAKRFDAAFDVATSKPRAFRIYNELDVVPHGWAPETVDQIETLYAPTLPSRSVWREAVEAALRTVKAGGAEYQHVGVPIRIASTIPRWRRFFYVPNLPIPGIALSKHVIELAYQHTLAYFAALEIPLTPEALRVLLPLTGSIPGSSQAVSLLLARLRASYDNHIDTAEVAAILHRQEADVQTMRVA